MIDNFAVVAAALAVLVAAQNNVGPYSWMKRDRWDEINDNITLITRENCMLKSATQLRLPDDVVTHKPTLNSLLVDKYFDNRTAMIHMHNMALSRSMFFSYIYQRLNDTLQWKMQPNLHYIYYSVEADVAANAGYINGSGLFWDKNESYPNFYNQIVYFNTTILFFGPRAWRSFDDYREPTNWVREPTNNTIEIQDYGAGPDRDYTVAGYLNNPWYSKYLPDKQLNSAKYYFKYTSCIQKALGTGVFDPKQLCDGADQFFGPFSPKKDETDPNKMPVLFTQPYFDCGRSNRWIISAVAPIIDFLPRYLNWTHLRRPRIIAESVIDMEFMAVDFNPCKVSEGNPKPNYLQDTDRCKDTSMCEPLPGFGFRRGGYICHCRPGYRYPSWQLGPWQGSAIERAVNDERKGPDFACPKVGWRMTPKDFQNEVTSYDEDFGQTLIGRRRREAGETPVDKPKTKKKDTSEQAAEKAAKKAAKREKEEAARRAQEKAAKKAAKREKEAADRQQKETNKMVEEMTRLANELNRKISEDVAPADQQLGNKYISAWGSSPAEQSRRAKEEVTRRKRSVPAVDFDRRKEANAIFVKLRGARSNTDCSAHRPDDLIFPQQVGFGAEKFFDPQARFAVRLANFLSNVLQTVSAEQSLGNVQVNNTLNTELLFGEVLSIVMGDVKIYGAGLYFDINQYDGLEGKREFFAPFAYRPGAAQDGKVSTEFKALDLTGSAPRDEQYTFSDWFLALKHRWFANIYGLERYRTRAWMRNNPNGDQLQRFDRFPLFYYAANVTHGTWSAPYFDCSGFIKDWVIRYSVPFFGPTETKEGIEFKGSVAVFMKLDDMDINQCPEEYHSPNPFKSTAICNYETTYCVHMPRSKFRTGGYKCECRQGYEYPFQENAWYFDGATMEKQYMMKTVQEINNRFDQLKCRLASAVRPAFTALLLLLLLN